MKPVFALNVKLAVAGLFLGWLTAFAAEPAFWSWAKTPHGLELLGLLRRGGLGIERGGQRRLHGAAPQTARLGHQ